MIRPSCRKSLKEDKDLFLLLMFWDDGGVLIGRWGACRWETGQNEEVRGLGRNAHGRLWRISLVPTPHALFHLITLWLAPSCRKNSEKGWGFVFFREMEGGVGVQNTDACKEWALHSPLSRSLPLASATACYMYYEKNWEEIEQERSGTEHCKLHCFIEEVYIVGMSVTF